MLKGAVYSNVFLLLIMSIFFLTRIFKKNYDLKKLRKIIIIYIIFNLISSYLCISDIVDLGMNFMFLLPISIISFVMYIISICFINKKVKKSKNSNNLDIKSIILVIVPIIVFMVPYLYELYVINNCKYLLEYNYQNGFIQTDNTYIAIINNKPVTTTLQRNLFKRKGTNVDDLYYHIVYNDDDVEISMRDSNGKKIIINNEDIKNIALNAKEKCPSAKGASLYYFSEGNYAIIELTSENAYGTLLGEYFYHNNTYIQDINTHGNLKSITYYK